MSHKFHAEPVEEALEREADRAALLTGRGWSAAALGLSCPLRRHRSPAGDTDTASAPARSCEASLSGGAAGEPAMARDLDRAAGARAQLHGWQRQLCSSGESARSLCASAASS